MTDKNLDRLGSILMQQVRDDVLDTWAAIISGKIKAPRLAEISRRIRKFNGAPEQLVAALAPEIVDACLSRMLAMLQSNEEFALLVNGEDVRDASDGLAGELYGEDGWIAKHSSHPTSGV
jgi:hypothetical protein